MESSRIYLFVVAGAAVLVLAVGGFLFFGRSGSITLGGQKPDVNWRVEKAVKGSTFVVDWSNLPPDTSLLNIYKTDPVTGKQSLWGTVPVSKGSQASGTVEIATGKKLTDKDEFSVEAKKKDDEILWTSPTSTPETDTPPAPSSTPLDPPPPPPQSPSSSDTTSPNVSFAAPAAGATVSSTVTLSATASDAGGVANVQFSVDGVVMAIDTTFPYSTSLNTANYSNGNHTLQAVAADASGNTGTASRSVTVNNLVPPPPDTTPPNVSFTAPAAGATVSSTITLSATASDAGGVANVQFSVDGVDVAIDTISPYSAPLDTAGYTNGSHTLQATATDPSGNTGTASVAITVNNAPPPPPPPPPPPDTTPPAVSVTAPAAGATVSSTVTLSATASDAGGVANVQFSVDGVVMAIDTTFPYSTSLNTANYSNGNHTLQAVAADASGNTDSDSVSVVLSNTGAPPPPPPPPPPPAIPSFQVSNSTEWIEITWQNLPVNATLISISRADSPGGPWDIFFSQPDPETAGPYTVKVVIDTPNTPFYYELTAYENSTLIGTYGPVYLSALQQ